MSDRKFKHKRIVGFLGGVLLCLILWNLPIQGLSADGQICLSLSLMVVVWWATGAMHPGYSALALLLGYCLLLDPGVVPRTVIFGLWASPTIYLVIGGFLIAAAVKGSGLGQRIALNFIKRFGTSYQSIIISCYVLGFLLSFMIPHPWPRSFLLVSVMAYVINAAKMEKKYEQNIGLAIFAGSIPTAAILLTGDSTLNPAVAGFAGVSVRWLEWVMYMGLPGILASVLTCACQLRLFGGPAEFHVDVGAIDTELKKQGKLTKLELKTVAVIVCAVVLWGTDSFHGIHPGWIALGIAILLSTPFINALDAGSWSQVNPGTLFFLCAALAIGSVGGITGMNEWIADLLMPGSVSSNPYVFALLATAICVVLHMVLGSTLTVLGIASPAIVSFGLTAGVPPLASALIAYTAVALHWMLPFHHMNLLVGAGEHFKEKDAVRLGVAQTLIIAVVVLFEVFWWGLVGLL